MNMGSKLDPWYICLVFLGVIITPELINIYEQTQLISIIENNICIEAIKNIAKLYHHY